MSIIIGSARIDERGKLNSGKAGDQKQTSNTNDTIGEVSMQNFYVHSKGWNVFRPKSADVAEKIALEMKYACNNKNLGYDQYQRGTLLDYVKKHKIKSLKDVAEKVECDCSSLIRAIIYVVTGKDVGDFNTSSEATVLKNSGLFNTSFAYVSSTKTPVKNGDICVTKTKGHTVAVVSGATRKTSTDKGVKHYPKYTGNSNSIVEALSAVGEKDTSIGHRTKIAKANGITSYTGKSEQNISMLKLLKSGKLIKV